MTCWASAWCIYTHALAHVWFTGWDAHSLGLGGSWGGICTSSLWPCRSDLMTSVKETVEGRHAYEISMNTGCILMSWAAVTLPFILWPLGRWQAIPNLFLISLNLNIYFSMFYSKSLKKKREIGLFSHLQKRDLCVTQKRNKSYFTHNEKVIIKGET